MTDINTDGAKRFGAEEQQRSADAQRQANAGGDKCDIIVVLSPTSKSDDVQSLDREGSLQNFNFTGVKSHDRLVQLLSHVSQPLRGPHTAYDILLPKNGVPAEISAVETFDNNYAARVVRYSVNLTVNEMRGLLSRALFDVVGDKDLNDVMASAGIFALYLTENKQAVNVLQELERQFDAMRKSQQYRSVADLSDDELEQPLLDWRALPGANNFVLIEGVKRAFVIQNTQGQLVTFSNSVIGESNVASQNTIAAGAVDLDDESEQFDDEPEVEGKDWLGYQADQLTIEQKSEALTALGYDLTDWEEEAIADTFIAEQEKFLEDEDGDDESESDEDSDEEETEEDGDDEVAFDAVDTFGELLDAAQYDRQNLKRVIIILGGTCLKSDTEETLTAKILANIAERELDEAEFVELLDSTLIPSLNERGADASVFDQWIDEGDEQAEADAEEEAEQEDEDEEDGPLDFVDALDAFEHDGATLTHEQRIAALVALGESVEGLNVIQVVKLFRAKQAENGLNTFEPEQELLEEDEDGESEIAVLLATADESDLTTILDLIGVEYDSETDLVQAIIDSGTEQHHADNLEAAAATYGLTDDATEGLTYDDLLAAFLTAYFSDESSDLDEDEDSEQDTDFAETIGEQIIEAAGTANPLGLSVADTDDQKFLIAGERTPAGQLMSVDMPQSLLINFTLTDRTTFESSEELADIEGVNYRFPFTNPKSEDKARGSMYQPAATLIEIMENAATPRFLVDRNQFDVEQFSNQLNVLFESELAGSLYEGLLEAGEDPRETGIKVGDFIDDEMLEETDIDPEYWKDFAGDDLPLYTFINGHVGVRPITLEERNSVLCLGVLNVALPGVWATSAKKMPSLINSAVNAVKSMLAANTKINVYVGFTLSSGSLVVDDTLAQVVSLLRDNHSELFTYSSADCALFADNDDVMEIAASLDNVDRLPLEVLSSGYADKTFENGGDLTILIPCFEAEEIDDEDDSADDEDEE